MLLLPQQKNHFFNAIKSGDLETVQTFLDIPGFNPDTRNLIGANGLHCAARYDQTAIIPHLFAAGTKIDALDGLNATPLMVATEYNRSNAVRDLLLLDADPDGRVENGATPLMLAAEQGNKTIMKNLIAHGADVHAISGRFEGRRNCLNYALEAQKYDAADFLIRAGAKPWFVNRHQIAAAPSNPRIMLEIAQQNLTDADRRIMAPQTNPDDVYNHNGPIIDVKKWQDNRPGKNARKDYKPK